MLDEDGYSYNFPTYQRKKKKVRTSSSRITFSKQLKQMPCEPLNGFIGSLAFMDAESLVKMRILNQEWRLHSEADRFWLTLVNKRWPGMNAMKDAGLFAKSSAMKWYLRRCQVEEKSCSYITQRPSLYRHIKNMKRELSKYRLLVEMKTESTSDVFLSGLYSFCSANEDKIKDLIDPPFRGSIKLDDVSLTLTVVRLSDNKMMPLCVNAYVIHADESYVSIGDYSLRNVYKLFSVDDDFYIEDDHSILICINRPKFEKGSQKSKEGVMVTFSSISIKYKEGDVEIDVDEWLFRWRTVEAVWD